MCLPMQLLKLEKGLDISKKLGGENYVFWGGREGYESLLNTNMKFRKKKTLLVSLKWQRLMLIKLTIMSNFC